MEKSIPFRYLLLAGLGGLLSGHAQAQTAPPTCTALWSAGGAGAVSPAAVANDTQGDTFVAGRFAGVNVAFGPAIFSAAPAPSTQYSANTSGYLLKNDASGAGIWAAQAATTGSSAFTGVATDAAGSVYATGYYSGTLTLGNGLTLAANDGRSVGFAVKYSAQGTAQWAMRLAATGLAVCSTIVVAGNNVYVGGDFNGTLTTGSLPPLTTAAAATNPLLVQLNAATGTPQWARQLAANGASTAVAVDGSGNVTLTGSFNGTLTAGTTTLTTAGTDDIFLAHYTAAGTLLWAQRAGGTGQDAANALVADSNGTLFLAGYLSAAGGTVAGTTFGAGAAGSGSQALVAAYSAAGAGLWAHAEVNSAGASCVYNGAALDRTGNLLLVGTLAQTATVAGQVLTTHAEAGQDALLASYSAAGAGLSASILGSYWAVAALATCAGPANAQTVVGTFPGIGGVPLSTTAGTISYLVGGAGTRDTWVAKYNASNDGAFAFRYALSSRGGRDSILGGVAADAQGNSYVAGTFSNNIRLDNLVLTATTPPADAQYPTNGYVAKYGPAGNVLWAQRLGCPDQVSVARVVLDAAGNVYVAGSFNQTLTVGTTTLTSLGGSGSGSVFLLKLTAQGNLLWAKAAGGTGSDYASSLAVNAAGRVVLAGGLYSRSATFGSLTAAGPGAFVASYDAATGAAQWVRTFQRNAATASGYVGGSAVALDAAGNSALAGYFNGSVVLGATTFTAFTNAQGLFLARLDPQGNLLWARQATTSSTASGPLNYVSILAKAITFDATGSLVVAGSLTAPYTFGSTTLTPPGGTGLFLTKYSAAGDVQWALTNDSGVANGTALVADAAGNFYLGGGYSGSFTLNKGSLFSADSQYKAFVARFDAQGANQWLVAPNSSALGSSADGLAVGPDGTLLLAGSYGAYLSFNNGKYVLPSEFVDRDVYVARFGNATALAAHAATPAALGLYPNPAHDRATVQLPAGGTPGLRLLDGLGREVRRYPAAAGPEAVLDVRGLPAGLYVLRGAGSPQRLVVE